MKRNTITQWFVVVPVVLLMGVLAVPQAATATLPDAVDELVSLPAIDLAVTSSIETKSETTTESDEVEASATAAAKSESKVVVTTSTVYDKTPTECRLEINKSVDTQHATVGDTLTYTIDIENTGTAKCTGGGVRIQDVLDHNLQLDDYTYTSNLSEGYGSKPVFTESDRTIRFNGHDLIPGEAGQMVLFTSVQASDQCGDFTVKNKAKATAKELNNFKDWAYSDQVKTEIDNDCPEPEVPVCTSFTAVPDSIMVGETMVLTWETENATEVTIDNDLGTFGPNGFLSVAPTETTTYTLTVVNDTTHKTDTCTAKVTVEKPEKPMQPQCPLTPQAGRTIVDFSDNRLRSDRSESNAFTAIAPAAFGAGQYDITLVSWDGYTNRVNATQPNESYVLEFMNGSSVVGTSNPVSDLADRVIQDTKNELVNTDYTLASNATGVRAAHTVFPDKTSPNSLVAICAAIDEIPEEPLPVCESFTGTPMTLPVDGGVVELNWNVTDATSVEITPVFGSVDLTGSATTSITETTTFTLNATGTADKVTDCTVTITVPDPEPLPICTSFTASPSILPVGGGDVTLDWEVFDANSVVISPTVGTVDAISSTTLSVTESTTFELVATNSEGEEDRCEAPVAVPDPVAFTCEDNVTFTASDTSITRGDSTTLNWDTVDADSVSISVINATDLTGDQSVSPTADTTYVLTATKGNESVECPLTINVSTGGGGGGGSSSPRCELEISDSRIKAGEEITLTWETSRTNDVVITDDLGNVIIDTNDMLSDEAEDLLDGEITLTPTRDTEYTLVAERGSRDRECSVEVEVEDDVVVIETRDQAPLVAGISLSQVPYTGFEAGPLMTFVFYTLLLGWSLFLAYVLVIPRTATVTAAAAASTSPVTEMKRAEAVRPDVFAPIVASTATAPTAFAPANLPIAPVAPVAAPTMPATATPATPVDVAALEAIAHNNQALLSSDAVHTFIASVSQSEQLTKMVSVVNTAKAQFPLEDGWVVINNDRMLALLVA